MIYLKLCNTSLFDKRIFYFVLSGFFRINSTSTSAKLDEYTVKLIGKIIGPANLFKNIIQIG